MNTNNMQLDSVFHALADSTRRSILLQIRESELTVSDITAQYDVSMAAVSKHLDVLEKAGLIKRIKQGRKRYCKVVPQKLFNATQWLEHYQQFWTANLDRLQDLLENDIEE